MLPAAPARLSTTNCWPSASASLGVTRRVVMSTPAPGGKPTRTRTGFTGYDWAPAGAIASAMHAGISSTARRRAANMTDPRSGKRCGERDDEARNAVAPHAVKILAAADGRLNLKRKREGAIKYGLTK